MNLLETIQKRRSFRTFDGRPLSKQDCEKILNFARQADNPYDIPIEWCLLSVEKDRLVVPVVTGCDTYIAGKMKKVPHAEEAFGYAFEKVVLYATSLGIGTTWIAGTMERKGFEEAIDLKEDEVMPCVSPLGYPAKKMSFRETMMRKGIRADSRLPFEELFYEGDFAHVYGKENSELNRLLEYVRFAPSAINKQPWRIVLKDGYAHFYEKKDKGYTSKDNWDIQKIDMGIAMCHFALGLEEAGKAVDLINSDPGIETTDKIRYIASIRY